MKKCSKCKEEKDFNCFHKNKKEKFGLHHYCKDCNSKHRKDNYNYKKNKDVSNLKKYNLTEEQIKKMFESQDGKCLICEKQYELYSVRKGLYVDHCHKTNKVRGLLCTKCNTLLGIWNDNVDILSNAIKYLLKNK
jgi:hypothetical protein